MWVPFNINNQVRYRLRDRGRKILRQRHEELRKTCPALGEYREPATDADGWCTDQLWFLMGAFGSDMCLGMDTAIETVIYFEVKEPA